MKAKKAHIFDREEHEHYVEPDWVSRRLFDVEKFSGLIFDPCCGFGRIPVSAAAAGYQTIGSDIVWRGYGPDASFDFFRMNEPADVNIVCNPPFNIFESFAMQALAVGGQKIAMVWLVARMNAARWLQGTPLARVHLLTPRPSMPPGHVISAGGKVGGGTQDFCWLVWDKAHVGPPVMHWLHRDKPYSGQADFSASLNVGYEAIRERQASGGPGWERKA